MARCFVRSTSWVSRRMGLVELLPDSVEVPVATMPTLKRVGGKIERLQQYGQYAHLKHGQYSHVNICYIHENSKHQ